MAAEEVTEGVAVTAVAVSPVFDIDTGGGGGGGGGGTNGTHSNNAPTSTVSVCCIARSASVSKMRGIGAKATPEPVAPEKFAPPMA